MIKVSFNDSRLETKHFPSFIPTNVVSHFSSESIINRYAPHNLIIAADEKFTYVAKSISSENGNTLKFMRFSETYGQSLTYDILKNNVSNKQSFSSYIEDIVINLSNQLTGLLPHVLNQMNLKLLLMW